MTQARVRPRGSAEPRLRRGRNFNGPGPRPVRAAGSESRVSVRTRDRRAFDSESAAARLHF